MDQAPESPDKFEENEEVTSEAIDAINKGLNLIGTSPIKKRKSSQKHYSVEKVKRISEALSEKLFYVAPIINDHIQSKRQKNYINGQLSRFLI